MSYLVGTHITIGDLEMPFVMEGVIKSSWKNLTDTAVIKLPRKVKVLQNFTEKSISEVIKKGDKVTIKAGYDGELNTEFEGYVSEVVTGVPLTIKCEDEMWMLKQSSNIQASWRNATLKNVIDKIAPGIKTHVLDMELGAFRINEVNSAQVLQELKKMYGLKSYFKNKELYVGFAYPLDTYKKVKHHFQKNIVDRLETLKYRTKEDIKIQLRAISILPDNTKIEIKLGDEDGALRTLHYYNISEQELEQIANREIDDLKYDGFRGSFTGFHLPICHHGDITELQDDLFKERNGSYYIDGVTLRFGYNTGIKRDIELGKLASSEQITAANA